MVVRDTTLPRRAKTYHIRRSSMVSRSFCKLGLDTDARILLAIMTAMVELDIVARRTVSGHHVWWYHQEFKWMYDALLLSDRWRSAFVEDPELKNGVF